MSDSFGISEGISVAVTRASEASIIPTIPYNIFIAVILISAIMLLCIHAGDIRWRKNNE